MKDNRMVYAFVILGVILVVFPNEMGIAAPYVLGIGQIIYGCLSVILSLKYPDSLVSLGDGLVSIIIGVTLLIQKGDSVAALGFVWAMISLTEAAKEIDEYRRTKKVSVINICSIIVTIVLAFLLMANPFAHFYTHVRILGLEIIASAIVKGRMEWKKRKEKDKVL